MYGRLAPHVADRRYIKSRLWLQGFKNSVPTALLLAICLFLQSCNLPSDQPSHDEPAFEIPTLAPTLTFFEPSIPDNTDTPLSEQSGSQPSPSVTPPGEELPQLTDTPGPNQPPTETSTPTLEPTPEPTPTATIDRVFDTFVRSVINGRSDVIVGVYVENILALPVVQQPSSSSAWVSPNDFETTQFIMAFVIAGNVGLLAHNFLAGRFFFDLMPGHIVQLIYGDGSVVEYELMEIKQYQALQPNSVYSDFVDLETGETVSSTNLFNVVYAGEHHLTFQTCLNREGNSEWGRHFPIAYPY
jgi:hypothetical protein